MKQFVASILLLMVSFQAFYPGVFTGWFFANRAAIIRQYCVNKQRPMLHCDGKCYLARKIQAAEEKQARQENAGPRNMWVETAPAIVEQVIAAPVIAVKPVSPVPAMAASVTADGHRLSIFRPPAILG